MTQRSDFSRVAFFGILSLKQRWGLSVRGWIVVLLTMISAGGVFVLEIVPFLAVTRRVDARVLVVEGWVHDYVISEALNEFKAGAYERTFTTGGPVLGNGGYTNDFNTTASVAAERLVSAGQAASLVQMVASHVMDRDRTFGSAVALRTWLIKNNIHIDRVNIMTEDLHARRTRLLFQRALGEKIAVGIIAVPNPDYDLNRWWRYSEGTQEVFRESVAYVYAKFFFHPSTP